MGCTSAQAFREVTLPLSLPGLAPACCCASCWRPAAMSRRNCSAVRRDALFGNLIYDTIMSQLNWPMGATLSIVLFVLLGICRRRLQPLHGPVADHEGDERVSGVRRSRGPLGLAADLRRHACCVYIFMFAPIVGDDRAVVQRLDVRRLPDHRLQPALVRHAVRERSGAGRVPDIAVDRAGHGGGDHAGRHRGGAGAGPLRVSPARQR